VGLGDTRCCQRMRAARDEWCYGHMTGWHVHVCNSAQVEVMNSERMGILPPQSHATIQNIVHARALIQAHVRPAVSWHMPLRVPNSPPAWHPDDAASAAQQACTYCGTSALCGTCMWDMVAEPSRLSTKIQAGGVQKPTCMGAARMSSLVRMMHPAAAVSMTMKLLQAHAYPQVEAGPEPSPS
jgi:hypothetical protein